MMKYNLYLSSNIEVLSQDAEHFGMADSYSEACRIIQHYLKDNGYKDNHYWRFLMNDTATFIDFGSWSKFIAIIPPIPMKEIMGENYEEN